LDGVVGEKLDGGEGSAFLQSFCEESGLNYISRNPHVQRKSTFKGVWG
jgi:hypothetical protein